MAHLRVVLPPTFPHVPPSLQLVNMAHPLADSAGVINPGRVGREFNQWSVHHNVGRLLFEFTSLLQRPVLGLAPKPLATPAVTPMEIASNGATPELPFLKIEENLRFVNVIPY